MVANRKNASPLISCGGSAVQDQGAGYITATAWGGPASQFTSSHLLLCPLRVIPEFSSTDEDSSCVTWSSPKSSLQLPWLWGQVEGRHSIQSFAMTLCLLTGCPFCKYAESGRYSSESSLCTQSFGQSQGVQKERKAVVEFLGQKWFERSSSHFSRSVWWWWQALCCGFC